MWTGFPLHNKQHSMDVSRNLATYWQRETSTFTRHIWEYLVFPTATKWNMLRRGVHVITTFASQDQGILHMGLAQKRHWVCYLKTFFFFFAVLCIHVTVDKNQHNGSSPYVTKHTPSQLSTLYSIFQLMGIKEENGGLGKGKKRNPAWSQRYAPDTSRSCLLWTSNWILWHNQKTKDDYGANLGTA